jgi:hypothetical protein
MSFTQSLTPLARRASAVHSLPSLLTRQKTRESGRGGFGREAERGDWIGPLATGPLVSRNGGNQGNRHSLSKYVCIIRRGRWGGAGDIRGSVRAVPGEPNTVMTRCSIWRRKLAVSDFNSQHRDLIIRKMGAGKQARMAGDAVVEFEDQRPISERLGWSSGRRPSGQRYLRSEGEMGRSLMQA